MAVSIEIANKASKSALLTKDESSGMEKDDSDVRG